jgi:hypothetical protein
MAETPEQKYNRIAAAVQQTILNNFPNPSRVGCPGDSRVREVAGRRTIVEDDDWQHVTHCSACYAEFLAAKEQIRKTGYRERTLGLIGGTALLILLSLIVGYRYFAESRTPSIIVTAFEPATLNLKDSSTVRGDGQKVQENIPELPRRPLELKVILPFGSEPGLYQFELVDPEGRVLKSGEATATILNGDTFLTTRLNTADFGAGIYKFGLRQPSVAWVFSSLRLL